jgi:hypothetical protein
MLARWPLSRVVGAGALLGAIACGGEPTTPPNPPGPLVPVAIQLGDTVEGVLAPGDSVALFMIQPAERVDFAIFIQAESGGVSFTVTDSTSHQLLFIDFVDEDPDLDHLTFARSGRIEAEPGRIVLVRIGRFQTATAGRFRLWPYRINRAPEARSNDMAIEDTVSGETLENSADVDEFRFSATAGDELIAFMQGEQGFGGLSLDVLTEADERIGGASAGVDTELEASSGGRFVIPTDGTYRAVVSELSTRATGESAGAGGFRALIRRIDRRPEHTPVVISPSDTLETERTDFVGDIDEFQVPVIADSAYNVFLQAMPSADAATLRVTVSMGDNTFAALQSNAGDSALAGQFTGDFVAAASGNLTLQVAGLSDAGSLHRGAYRLFVYPVNRAPELAAKTVTAGDSVIESIEYPGDVDEFTVSQPATPLLNLILRRGNARSESVDLRWLSNGQTTLLGCSPLEGEADTGCGTAPFVISGTTSVEIASQLGMTTGFRGPYRLVTTPIDPLPEGRPQQIAIGDVVNEAVDPVGDTDEYLFAYSAGDLIEVDGSGGNFLVENPSGEFMPGFADHFGPSTGRFTLPSSGTYRLLVGGASGGQPLGVPGPYTFEIGRVSSAAEIVTSPLHIGDSTTVEPISPVGDVDDFVVEGPPGAEVQVLLRGTTRLFVDAVAPGTSTLVRAGTRLATGRLTLPGDGRVGLRVYEPRTYSGALRDNGLGFSGPYAVTIHQIDRASETLPSAITVGTTVDDVIEFEGDIDEFTFTASAGQRISGSLSAPLSFGGGPFVRLDIVDPATDAILGTTSAHDATVFSTGAVTLPSAGTYRVRVYGADDQEGRGAYRFVIR